MSRGRILLVKPVLPYPPDQGTKVVSTALIDALAPAHDVTVLARLLSPGEERYVRELEARGVRVVATLPANRASAAARVAYKLAYTARALTTRRSLKSLYDCPGSTIRAARELAREPFDLVILEYWQLYPLLDVFSRHNTVLLTHDIDAQVFRARAAIERDLRTQLRARTTWRREAREEADAYRRAKRVWALTPRDADEVKAISGRRASVLPFGLDESAFAGAIEPRMSREVLLVGAMHSAFNRDAAVHFVRDIYPAIASLPGVRVTVVGGDLPPEIADFAGSPNVEIAGHAPDIGPFMRRAACLVVPLRFAGGIRIRILYAMAAGLPVVCSPVAVEGMGLEPGRDVLTATTPAEYRSHIERLLDHATYGQQIAQASREKVWNLHGPEARGPGLRGFVERAMAEERC
ncbi:MAG TPA: glycosyltransferase [Candidatus Krumholzibacteria bacterium]|nr:glycosyltransferase [Candidatus Krumholzibacteria bacterium]